METMGTGSVIKAQDAIFAALHGNKSGVDDHLRAPLDQCPVLESRGNLLYYAVNNVDVDVHELRAGGPLGLPGSQYVRVSLANGGYGKFTSGGLHATEATGYDDNAGTVTSYDPWSKRSSSSNAACTSTAYGSGTWGLLLGDAPGQVLTRPWTKRRDWQWYSGAALVLGQARWRGACPRHRPSDLRLWIEQPHDDDQHAKPQPKQCFPRSITFGAGCKPVVDRTGRDRQPVHRTGLR